MWLFLLVVASGLVGFYFPFLINQHNFYLSDASLYFEPLIRFLADSFRQLKIPLWNPLVYCGTSQIAIISPGIFYPPNWLHAVLPFSPALAINLIFHQTICALGAYLLIMSFGWGAPSAYIAGFICSFTGYMFSLQANYTLVETASWIPLSLWSINRISDTKTAPASQTLQSLMLAIVVVFMLVASGRPELSEPAILVLLFSVLIRYIRSFKDNWKNAARVALLQLMAIGVALMLIAPAILPALEWKSLSARHHSLKASEIFLWSANWYDLLSMIFAQPLGDLSLLYSKYLGLVATRQNYIPYLASAFVGPAALTLGLFGVVDRSFKWRWLVLAIFGASLIMACGLYTPLAPWLINNVPILAIYRYPVKLLIFAVFAIAIFAARGLWAINNQKIGKKGQVFVLTIWSCMLAFLISLLIPQVAAAITKLWVTSALQERAMVALKLIARSGIVGCIVGISISLLSTLCLDKKLSKTTFTTIVISVLFASLLSSAVIFHRHFAEATFYSQESYIKTACTKLDEQENLKEEAQKAEAANLAIKLQAIRIKRSHQYPRPGYDTSPISTSESASDESPITYTAGQAIDSRVLPLYFGPLSCPRWYQGTGKYVTPRWYHYSREMLVPNCNMDFGMPSSFGYEAAETQDYRKLYISVLKRSNAWTLPISSPSSEAFAWTKSDLPLSLFCKMTATKYAFTQVFGHDWRQLPLLDANYFDLVKEDKVMNVRIWRVKEKMPRAYFSDSWTYAASHEDVLNKMIYPDQSGFDPKLNLFLEHIQTKSDPFTSTSRRHHRSVSQLIFVQDQPEHILLNVRCSVPGFLVLADHYWPGWQATIDARPTKIYRANGILRAVFVPPGAHLVEFNYHPRCLYEGFMLSWFALAVIFGLTATSIVLPKLRS